MLSPQRFAAYREAWQRRVTREDRQHAAGPWLFANANRDRDAKPSPFNLEDFMMHTPPSPEREKKQIAEQHATLAEVFKSMAAGGVGKFTPAKTDVK